MRLCSQERRIRFAPLMGLLPRPVVVNMADHPEGYDLSKEQAVLVVCSTQVRRDQRDVMLR